MWEDRQVGRPGTGADTDLVSKEVPDHLTVCIESISISDLTTAAKIVRVGWTDGTTNFWIIRKTLAAGEYSLSWSGKILLAERHKIIGRVESAVAGDNLLLVSNGYYVD